MKYFQVLLANIFVILHPLQATQTQNINIPQSFFAQSANDNLYWQALVQLANGDKQAALQTAACLHNGTASTAHYPWQDNQPTDINAFFDNLFIHQVRHDPQLLTQLNLFESIGIHDHNAYLTDISVQAALEELAATKAHLACLNNYALEHLSPKQRVSHTIIAWKLQHAVAGEKFLFHAYKINQMDGVLARLTVLLTQFHSLNTKEDVDNYISRLSKIPEHFQQAIAFMELQKGRGIIPPRFTVEKVITMLKKSTPEDIRANIFYQHLAKQFHKIPNANGQALQKAHRVIAEAVYPAYKRLQNYFTHLLDVAQTNNGVWALPDGDAYYAYMLRHHTTTDLSADEIHALGLQEVAKIQLQMRTILAAENIIDPSKSIGALMQEVAKDSRFYYQNTAAGRHQCLTDYHHILERSRRELAHLFDLKPRAGVTIQPVPEHEQEGAPAAYYHQPSIDGSRPGIFFANLRDMKQVPKYSMETLTIHEAEPGHHFQWALQYEMNIPMLRKIGAYTAFSEGWALYTEKLAYEHNFYTSSYDKLGHLQDELLRAARLVVDTGIHYYRWSREQAIAYMQEVTGYHYESVVTEVERYFVLPGQACAYKIGQLKILALRKQAQETLQEKFDIREFHTIILQLANAPLMILEEVIGGYIQRKLAV